MNRNLNILKQPNVYFNFDFYDDVKKEKHSLEKDFISNIIALLEKEWPDFYTYNYYLIGANFPWNFPLDKKSIVFYLSNENHEVPEELEKALLVFTPYCPPKEKRAVNVLSIPLGYNGSIKNLATKQMENRKYDLFFSGNIHRARRFFVLRLLTFMVKNKLRKFKTVFNIKNKSVYMKSVIKLSHSFGGGLKPEVYADILMNSKIALVPQGYLSVISFRFFEAARFGNIIVTKKLPDEWHFNEFPGIEVETWTELETTLDRLMGDVEYMKTLQQKTIAFYETYCSEKAVANYVRKQLKKLNYVDNYLKTDT